MSKLYLYNYNNYFNKIVKKETSLANYGTPIYSIANVNFNYNDGVNTSHVINYNGQDGDYVIITDDSNNISSRWFVMENVRNRGGQHNLTLRRDLIVDFYNSVINAPMIINRAMLTTNNPLIYNPEGFSFNQIKKEEILLKDRLGIPWIILYMAKNAESAEITIPSNSYTPDITLNTSIENSIYAAGTKYTKATATTYIIDYMNSYRGGYGGLTYEGCRVKFDVNLAYKNNISLYEVNGDLAFSNTDSNYFIQQVGATLVNNYSNYDTLLNTYLAKPTITDANLALIKKASDQGLVIKDTNNKYYKIQVIINDSGEEGDIPSNDPLFTAINNVITSSSLTPTHAASTGTYRFGTNYDEVITIVTDVSSQYGNNITLDPTTKFETMDSECNIIAIPYADTFVHNSYYMEDDTPIFTDLTITKDNQLNIAMQFAQKYTNTFVYDMQLIPYCPVQQFIEQDNHLDVSGYSGQTGYYTKWNLDTGYVGVVFHLTSKQLSFDINQRLSIPTVTGDINLDTKISNECDIVRLCSPNFNGIFEFSVAKNNGVDSFNVDITLRPYNPYIHINPNFKNIYGYDFNDARGLICGGDFSLPITGDQFEQYELQNKNYQIAFNRQIEHMDFEYSIQKKEALFGAIAGTISGAAKGGFAGSAGGPYGAAAGAVVGGTLSGMGGVLDYSNLIARQRENRQFAIDNFRYQLGNIQALPYNLNKVNPFTLNNKIFPFIEIYSCTDEEKTILINKITYTSMNVNAIGKISDYLQSSRTFIQGDLIRLKLDISEHELIEIYNELKRGVYI